MPNGGFADNAAAAITISNPQGSRSIETVADGLGTLTTFDADPPGTGPYGVEAAESSGSATASYEVVAPEVNLNPHGDVLRPTAWRYHRPGLPDSLRRPGNDRGEGRR
jgi:hypothetical protein